MHRPQLVTWTTHTAETTTLLDYRKLYIYMCNIVTEFYLYSIAGADPGFDRGGAQIVTGLKLPFWGLSFGAGASFLVVRGGGPGPPGPPSWIRPWYSIHIFNK